MFDKAATTYNLLKSLQSTNGDNLVKHIAVLTTAQVLVSQQVTTARTPITALSPVTRFRPDWDSARQLTGYLNMAH